MAADPSAAAFLRKLLSNPVGGLLSSNKHQNAPKVIAIRELGKTAFARAAAEAVKCTQRDILLVRHSPSIGRQLLLSQVHEPLTIPLPQVSKRRVFALLEPLEPAADRSFGH